MRMRRKGNGRKRSDLKCCGGRDEEIRELDKITKWSGERFGVRRIGRTHPIITLKLTDDHMMLI